LGCIKEFLIRDVYQLPWYYIDIFYLALGKHKKSPIKTIK